MSRRSKRVDFVGKIAAPGQSREDALFVAKRTTEGFLVVDGRLMREGTLEYGDGDATWGEYRSREEIDRALESFHRSVVTLDHPSEFVNLGNAKEHWAGHIGDRIGWDPDMPDHVRATFTITGQDAIEAIERGTAELSVGFSAVVDERPGVDEQGREYRFVQRDLIGNHVAIVAEGRAGPDARLLLDSAHRVDSTLAVSGRDIRNDTREEAAMAKLQMGDMEYEVPDAVAAAFDEMKAKLADLEAPEESEEDDEAMAEKPLTELDGSKDSVSELRAKVDMLEAEVAKSRAEKAEAELAKLQDDAIRLGVDASKATSPLEVMVAVVQAKQPSIKLDGANEAYVRGAYKAVVELAADQAADQVSRHLDGARVSAQRHGWIEHIDVKKGAN